MRGNMYCAPSLRRPLTSSTKGGPGAAMRAVWPWIEQACKRLAHRNPGHRAGNKLARIGWAGSTEGRVADEDGRLIPAQLRNCAESRQVDCISAN